jgi:hypothetical protein
MTPTKKTALVIGGTANMAFAMGTLLLSLKASNGKLTDDVIIFHNGISERDAKKLEMICPVRFIEYRPPFDKGVRFNRATIDNFTAMLFCKYECLRLLEEYRAVIWMDYDMVVTGSLRELLTPVSGGARMILTRTLAENLSSQISDPELLPLIGNVGVHTSLFAFYDNLSDYMALYDWCVQSTARYADALVLAEQAVFSLMLVNFNLSIFPLPFDLYSPHPDSAGKVWDDYVKLWHCYGSPKFWNGLESPLWTRYFAAWNSLEA